MTLPQCSALSVLGGGAMGTACALALLAASSSMNPSNSLTPLEKEERRQKAFFFERSRMAPITPSTNVKTPSSRSVIAKEGIEGRVSYPCSQLVTVISRSRNFFDDNVASHPRKSFDNSSNVGELTTIPNSVNCSTMSHQLGKKSPSWRTGQKFPEFIRVGSSLDFVPHLAGDRLLVKSYAEYVSCLQKTEKQMKHGELAEDPLSSTISSSSFLMSSPAALCCCVPISGLWSIVQRSTVKDHSNDTSNTMAGKLSSLHVATNCSGECEMDEKCHRSKEDVDNSLSPMHVMSAFIKSYGGAACRPRCTNIADVLVGEEEDTRLREKFFRSSEISLQSGGKNVYFSPSSQLSPFLSSPTSLSKNAADVLSGEPLRFNSSTATTLPLPTHPKAQKKENADHEEELLNTNEMILASRKCSWCQCCDKTKNSGINHRVTCSLKGVLSCIPMVLVFTRGFTPGGATPAEHISLNCFERTSSESRNEQESVEGIEYRCSATPSSPVAVLTVCGPLLPREWAHQSAGLCGKDTLERKTDAAPPPPFSIPPKPSPFSGASFTVSLASEEDQLAQYYFRDDDSLCDCSRLTLHEVLFDQVKRLFPRENVSYYCESVHSPSFSGEVDHRSSVMERGRTAARNIECLSSEKNTCVGRSGGYVLGIVNGVLPLLSFGAGLVHSSYTTSSINSLQCHYFEQSTTTGALFSYAQNAVLATESLIEDLWRSQQYRMKKKDEISDKKISTSGTSSMYISPSSSTKNSRPSPLPPTVVSTLFLVCLDHCSREFILGKQLNYHFRKADALSAVFCDRSASDSWERKGSVTQSITRNSNYEKGEKSSDPNSNEGIETKGMPWSCATLGSTRCSSPWKSSSFCNTTIASSVDGLSALMERENINSPFFQALIDTYHTVLRASTIGQILVQWDEYKKISVGSAFSSHETVAKHANIAPASELPLTCFKSRSSSPYLPRHLTDSSFNLLDEIMKVDQAMVSGSEKDLKRASSQLVRWVDSSSSVKF